jgi:hypothetical protein
VRLRRRLAIVACSAMAAAALVASAAGATAARPTLVTLDGIGGVVPGMTAAQVAGTWGIPVRLGSDRATPGCQTATIATAGVHGYALFEHGRLGAVWFDRGVHTPSGIYVGSTVQQLVDTYGYRLLAQPAAYVPGGQWFFLTRQQSPHWQIRFDASASARITQIGFGSEAVHAEEGCV